MDKWHYWPLRVRYQETDQMGVVYHMNYLNWFEIGRTEMIRALGISYREIEEQGLFLPLTNAQIDFKQPARYDDCVIICTRIAQFSALRMTFEAEARRVETYDERQGELLVSVKTQHVWLDRAWKPTRIDQRAPVIFELLKSF
jgi:acyl-CoA thioester hydrolase